MYSIHCIKNLDIVPDIQGIIAQIYTRCILSEIDVCIQQLCYHSIDDDRSLKCDALAQAIPQHMRNVRGICQILDGAGYEYGIQLSSKYDSFILISYIFGIRFDFDDDNLLIRIV